jgi:hypothetical protein
MMDIKINRLENTLTFLIIYFFIGCTQSQVRRDVLVCPNELAPYDSIAFEYSTNSVRAYYYKMSKIRSIENYISSDGSEYKYIGEIHNVDGDSIGFYEYPFFTSSDTVFSFHYNEIDDAPPVPEGSKDFFITIRKSFNEYESSRKPANAVGDSIKIQYEYPFRILAIYVISKNEEFHYQKEDN